MPESFEFVFVDAEAVLRLLREKSLKGFWEGAHGQLVGPVVEAEGFGAGADAGVQVNKFRAELQERADAVSGVIYS